MHLLIHWERDGHLCSGFIFMFKKTHGLSSHRLHGIWNHIKGRCYTSTDRKYPDYGAIGVCMCEEWRTNFKSFYDWAISNGWEPGLQIDKDIKARAVGVVPGKMYSPEWCSVVTKKENANSKRNNRFITYNGVTKTVPQWAEEIGISNMLLHGRLHKGWSEEDALTIPKGLSKKRGGQLGIILEFNGKKQNIATWGRELGYKKGTLWNRYKLGWPVDKILSTSTKNTGKRKC